MLGEKEENQLLKDNSAKINLAVGGLGENAQIFDFHYLQKYV